jgi:hypothetical protein
VGTLQLLTLDNARDVSPWTRGPLTWPMKPTLSPGRFHAFVQSAGLGSSSVEIACSILT